MQLQRQHQQQQQPIGVIVPLITASNDSGVYELADVTRRYSATCRVIVIIPIDNPHVTDPNIDNAISMLTIAGAKVVGLLPTTDEESNDGESKQLMMAYKKYYPKLSGVAFMPVGDENLSEKVAYRAIFAKERVGFELVVAVVNVIYETTEAIQTASYIGGKHFELTPPGAIDVVLYYCYQGLPQELQAFKHERYNAGKFGFAVSKYRVRDIDSFRKIIKAVVSNFSVGRYIYIDGGKDIIRDYGDRPPFRSLSPYLEITMQTLERIAKAEEKINGTNKRTNPRKRVLLGEKEQEILYDGFGIRKINRDPGGKVGNKYVAGINGMKHYSVDKPSLLSGTHTRTFTPKQSYENLEWTTYLKLQMPEKMKKGETMIDSELVMYSFAVGFGNKNIKNKGATQYEINITAGGFIRAGKVVTGTRGSFRPGNGTNYPLVNWMGFKVTYHQYPDPNNRDDLPPHCRLELWMDEHAQDGQGNLVVNNNQADRWRNVFSTEDTGNWTMFAKRIDKKTKNGVKKKNISPMKILQRPITGRINSCTLAIAPPYKADVKFMTLREVEPLVED